MSRRVVALMNCPYCKAPDMITGQQDAARTGEARAWARCNGCSLHIGGTTMSEVLTIVSLINVGLEGPVCPARIGHVCP